MYWPQQKHADQILTASRCVVNMDTARSMAINLVDRDTLKDEIIENMENVIREVKEQIEDPAEQMLTVGQFVVNMDTVRGLVINQETKGFLIEDLDIC